MLTLKSDPDLKISDCTVNDTALVAFDEEPHPNCGFHRPELLPQFD
jgi:hypothetical protein